MLRTAFSHTSWKLINYRRVEDLIAAEFLHDLYNRHRPEINSIRFRNTICLYRGSDFRSYAPTEEWDQLARVLGQRFLNLDSDLLSQLRLHISYKKPRLTKLLYQLNCQGPVEDREELAQLILTLHYTALSEIYGVNLVQIEHALLWAIRQHIERNTKLPTEQTDIQVAQLIRTGQHTIAVQEELDALGLSLKVSTGAMDLAQAIADYSSRYGSVRFAYGAIDDSWSPQDRVRELCAQTIAQREACLRQLQAHSLDIQPPLAMDPTTATLCELAKEIGLLRDRNKALMGQVAQERNKLLASAAHLTGLPRRDLSRYLLAELYDVLTERKTLSEETVRSRWELVVFRRQECLLESGNAEKVAALLNRAHGTPESGTIAGICASPGVVQGYVKHVYNHQDASSITEASILVAEGTDFDMMDGICNCAGVITEEGGLLSHASVITRELGKPCLVGVGQALSQLPEGAFVELNATAGCVTLLTYPKPTMIAHQVIPLRKLNDWHQSGQKAYRLSQVAAMGFPTVPGVVLPVGFQSGSLSENLALEVLEALRAEGGAAEKILVRSSSPLEDTQSRSAAGIFTSAIASSDVASLLIAIKQVLDAGTSPRVRHYFGADHIPLAVLIQPYIEQDWGGVAFSRDPITGDTRVIVEASREGAHAVVEGRPQLQQTFQHSHLEGIGDEKDGLNLLLVTPDMILQFAARTAYQLEKMLNSPVDIEWGLSGRHFFIFQTRPITTVPLIAFGSDN